MECFSVTTRVAHIIACQWEVSSRNYPCSAHVREDSTVKACGFL